MGAETPSGEHLGGVSRGEMSTRLSPHMRPAKSASGRAMPARLMVRGIKHATGDGLLMAQAAGAGLKGMGGVMSLHIAAVDSVETAAGQPAFAAQRSASTWTASTSSMNRAASRAWQGGHRAARARHPSRPLHQPSAKTVPACRRGPPRPCTPGRIHQADAREALAGLSSLPVAQSRKPSPRRGSG